MKIINQAKILQEQIIQLKRQGKTIGFVPTMGNLHAGHLSLIEIAKKNADIIVASIFVNPMQFGEGEDLDKYPRTLNDDIEKLTPLDIDFLFTPTTEEIYPLGKETHTSVEVNRMSDNLCGKSRPGHFRGVTTVVNILFNIVQPDVAIFGKKDYQQYQIIQAMVKDLMLPIKIIGGEIIREKNGLAMSSRNSFLTSQQREQASQLRKIILNCAEKIKQEHDFSIAKENAIKNLIDAGFKPDYFEIINQQTLQQATPADKQILIAAAAWMGQPKLLDNLELTLD